MTVGDKSQYAKLNSILDALEHTGYYGFVTFIACVQTENVNAGCISNGLPTQKTQINAPTQFKTQSTQGLRNK